MPLTRISLHAGKSPDYRAALIAGVYAALRETFAVPEDDLFAVVHEHGAADFAFGRRLSRHRAGRRSGADPDHRQRDPDPRPEARRSTPPSPAISGAIPA